MAYFDGKGAKIKLLTIPVELLQENKIFDLQNHKLDIAWFVLLPYFSFQNSLVRPR